jgi:hypothetical protein
LSEYRVSLLLSQIKYKNHLLKFQQNNLGKYKKQIDFKKLSLPCISKYRISFFFFYQRKKKQRTKQTNKRVNVILKHSQEEWKTYHEKMSTFKTISLEEAEASNLAK